MGGASAPQFDEGLEPRYSAVRRQLHDEWALASKRLHELKDPDAARRVELFHQENVARAEALTSAEQNVRSALDLAVREAGPIAWNHRLGFMVAHLQRVHGAAFRDPAARTVRRFASEPELREWLDGWIAEDFEVLREVPGRHLTEGTRVKLDYVLTPRTHLLNAGFKPGPVGLEVKLLPVDSGFSPKASRFIWQAVSYTDCEFQVGGGCVRLPRVLLFSNISFEDELGMLKGIDHSALSNDRAKWSALLELANHANVGNFEIYGTRDRRLGCALRSQPEPTSADADRNTACPMRICSRRSAWGISDQDAAVGRAVTAAPNHVHGAPGPSPLRGETEGWPSHQVRPPHELVGRRMDG